MIWDSEAQTLERNSEFCVTTGPVTFVALILAQSFKGAWC